jgi:hypothetical protein
MAEAVEKRATLLRHFVALGPGAQELLMLTAERLAEGVAYGDFDDERNFEAEALQEAVDLIDYLTKRMLQQKWQLESARTSATAMAQGHSDCQVRDCSEVGRLLSALGVKRG